MTSYAGQQFIGGVRRASGQATLHSFDARTGQALPGAFHQATEVEVDAAAQAAAAAYPIYRALPAARRAEFLDAIAEALDALETQGRRLDAMRVRGFPFAHEVDEFIAAHDRVFVVEQNRDAQLRSMLVNEGEIDPGKLVPVLHYDGTPITARFIAGKIAQLMAVGQIEAAE